MSNIAEHISYHGPERRHHRVLVTRNSEYHCRDGVCVAVRDRHTGAFDAQHPALGKGVSGGLRMNREGGIASATSGADPKPGEQICFGNDEHTLITSELSKVVRPPKNVVTTYMQPSGSRARVVGHASPDADDARLDWAAPYPLR
jgi:hypothetical protein